MCAINYQKMMDIIFSGVGRDVCSILDSDKLSEIGINDFNIECDPLQSSGSASSAVLISYAAHLAGVDDIRPSFNVSAMKAYFIEKGIFRKVGEFRRTTGIGRIAEGDLIFFLEKNYDGSRNEDRIGIVYRANPESSHIWVISVNYRNEIYACVLDRYDECVVGFAMPYYGENRGTDNYAHDLMSEPDKVSYRVLQYVGKVVTNREDGFVEVYTGPGEKYAQVPWYPKVYNMNYVKVYDEFSDRTPGEAQRWLLVEIDNFCCGYIKKEYVEPAEFQTIYPSGNVAVNDVIHNVKLGAHSTCTDTNAIVQMPIGVGTVIEMNLYSSNPYKIRVTATTSDMLKIDFEGWVRPEQLEELRR